VPRAEVRAVVVRVGGGVGKGHGRWGRDEGEDDGGGEDGSGEGGGGEGGGDGGVGEGRGGGVGDGGCRDWGGGAQAVEEMQEAAREVAVNGVARRRR